jgi:hypothetical protein
LGAAGRVDGFAFHPARVDKAESRQDKMVSAACPKL